MKLSRLSIQNFRSFRDQTIDFDDYVCFVGPNGSGKSTVLNALNILFRSSQALSDTSTLTEEDFHLRDVSRPITITATFADLSKEAEEDLKAYVRQGQLVLSAKAEWNPSTKQADVKQVGSRQVIREFATFFEAEKSGSKASELKSLFSKIRESYPEVSGASTKEAMRNSLRDYEENHPDLCELVDSADQFYGWSKGANLLERHCQWIYIPAVKDPTEEQEEGRTTALGKLLQRTIRSQVDFKIPLDKLRQELGDKYQNVIDEHQHILKDVGNAVQERLRAWSHPGARVELLWHFDESKLSLNEPMARARIGDGQFLGEMVRVGHGMQRSFIVALLQLLAGIHEGTAPTLLLGFEEPELYQHPPQARHLASLLDELSQGNAQIIITTHSPYFISGKGFESVRMTRCFDHKSETRITRLTYIELANRLAQALGTQPVAPTSTMAAVEQIMQPSQNELFFSQIPILVEGPEDIAFVSTYLHLMGKWTDFRRFGCHFVVCGGKTNLSRPLAIAECLEIPAFVLFDGDCDKANGKDKQKHETDNKCILNLCGLNLEPLPDETHFAGRLIMWHTRIQEAIENEIGSDEWKQSEQAARAQHGLSDGVRQKHPLVISATLEDLWNRGIKSEILNKLCNCIIEHAQRISASATAMD
jgi:putative ATP-dependent endonuclease of the OLD family